MIGENVIQVLDPNCTANEDPQILYLEKESWKHLPMINYTKGAEKIAEWAKCLPHKHKDLNLTSQHSHEEPGEAETSESL